MAFQVGTSCYGEATQAAAAAASTQVGSVVQHGGAAYVVDSTGFSESTITYSLHPVSGGVPIVMTAPFHPQPCGLLDWQDGLLLGWLIAGAWIATAVVMFLRRGAHE